MATATQSDPSSSADPPAERAALELLRSAPTVSMRELPGDGIAVDVQPPARRNIWGLPVACFVGGIVCIAVGLYMYRDNPGLPQGYQWNAPALLLVMGFLNVALGPLILATLAVQGPPKPVAIEALPGRLKADRYLAGDHVVSSYGADDVQFLSVEETIESMLGATTRMGGQQLIAFGGREVNCAIALVLATRLWRGRNLLAGTDRVLGQWLVMPEPPEPPLVKAPSERC